MEKFNYFEYLWNCLPKDKKEDIQHSIDLIKKRFPGAVVSAYDFLKG